jgi:DNA-directed RNA polymerase subunit D
VTVAAVDFSSTAKQKIDHVGDAVSLEQVVEGDAGEFDDEEPEILRGVIETDNGELLPTEEFDHDLTNRYSGKEVSIEDVPGAFVFHVETDGSMSAEELFLQAVDSLGSRATELKEKVAV